MSVGTIEASQAACSNCSLRELCFPKGLRGADRDRVGRLVGAHRSVRRGEALFVAGDPFDMLYAVRVGFFKTQVSGEDGRAQVTGFQMVGELLGLDGIGDGRHTCEAIALEDSQVCLAPYTRVEAISREAAGLQRHFHQIMSREIVRDHEVMRLLGSMRAEARLAAFLLDLAQRLQARGFSASSLLLRMTREEIGSYLGLETETVSRAFSRLQDEGLLDVSRRMIRVLDEMGLRRLPGEGGAETAGTGDARRAGARSARASAGT